MLISEKLSKALNEQINAELYSSYLYLQMALEMEQTLGLHGFGHWFRCQWSEEQGHALRLIDYCEDRDCTVILQDIAAPVIAWECPMGCMEAAYNHEQMITKRIHDLMAMARSENDYATEKLLSWYVGEQVQEEASVKKIYQQLEQLGDTANGIIWLDKDLAKRSDCPALPRMLRK